MGSAGTYPLWNDEVQFPAVDRIPFPDTITHVAVHRAQRLRVLAWPRDRVS